MGTYACLYIALYSHSQRESICVKKYIQNEKDIYTNAPPLALSVCGKQKRDKRTVSGLDHLIYIPRILYIYIACAPDLVHLRLYIRESVLSYV